MVRSAVLGYPRMGPDRELKKALETYWKDRDSRPLLAEAARIRARHWESLKAEGIDFIPSGDFSLYDHVLDCAVMLGAVPARFPRGTSPLETYFLMARGGEAEGRSIQAMEMTKWFDTNYHYIVPELEDSQSFRLSSVKPIEHYSEARTIGVETRPVLLGPVTFFSLAKRAAYPLPRLVEEALPVYEEILSRLSAMGAGWVQIDEPVLVMELDVQVRSALRRAYERLSTASSARIMLTTYFGELGQNLDLALSLPVSGLHVDLVRGPGQLDEIISRHPPRKVISLGLVDGRNVWRTDLEAAVTAAEKCVDAVGRDRTVIATSCSLLHCPEDLSLETGLDRELSGWLAFAKQKCAEVAVITRALNQGREAVAEELLESRKAQLSRRESPRTVRPTVRARIDSLVPRMTRRASSYSSRAPLQRRLLSLPRFPTTTIGSFPQTAEVRRMRSDARRGRISAAAYEDFLKREVTSAIRFQEEIGLDVLVHGEFERTDMVEHFAQMLEGFAFTGNGWVQSYGSRCVKPPLIYGDVERKAPMTVAWSTFAQSLTEKPVKGMLTGPVTILEWSFVRDDQPREATCRQIALALRDEVRDLEAAGIRVIQVDEPALREGLPLRKTRWKEHLGWAVEAFRLATAGVRDDTQIHTHMCYSEFNEILPSIAEMDADVISIESARSKMELLGAFRDFRYPSQIGPGVYDIHSPRIPRAEEMEALLEKALAVIRPEQLWVNPDCGLKTREWQEVWPALTAMVEAARRLREKHP